MPNQQSSYGSFFLFIFWAICQFSIFLSFFLSFYLFFLSFGLSVSFLSFYLSFYLSLPRSLCFSLAVAVSFFTPPPLSSLFYPSTIILSFLPLHHYPIFLLFLNLVSPLISSLFHLYTTKQMLTFLREKRPKKKKKNKKDKENANRETRDTKSTSDSDTKSTSDSDRDTKDTSDSDRDTKDTSDRDTKDTACVTSNCDKSVIRTNGDTYRDFRVSDSSGSTVTKDSDKASSQTRDMDRVRREARYKSKSSRMTGEQNQTKLNRPPGRRSALSQQKVIDSGATFCLRGSRSIFV